MMVFLRPLGLLASGFWLAEIRDKKKLYPDIRTVGLHPGKHQ